MLNKSVLIICGRFNDLITNALLSGAVDTLTHAGLNREAIETVWVPGAFEAPTVAAAAARTKKYAAIICLGAVIRGDTPHFDYVAGEAARGLMQVGIETEVPVIFGILTTNTMEQALERAGLKGGNKGRDAAATALAMIKVLGSFGQKDRNL